MSYQRYMDSAAWRKKRAQRISLDGGRCVDCGAAEQLHVHHLNYRRLGFESMDDLVTVCHSCHENRHGRSFDRSRPRRLAEKKAHWLNSQLDAEFSQRLAREL